MTPSELVKNAKLENPTFGYRKLGRLLGLNHNTVKYHLKEGEKAVVQSRCKNWRQRFLVEIKEQYGAKCCVCDYDRDFTALEFHHTDPSLKDEDCNSLSRVLNDKGKAAFLKEVETCILVCSTCHREIHSGLILCEVSYGGPPR